MATAFINESYGPVSQTPQPLVPNNETAAAIASLSNHSRLNVHNEPEGRRTRPSSSTSAAASSLRQSSSPVASNSAHSVSSSSNPAKNVITSNHKADKSKDGKASMLMNAEEYFRTSTLTSRDSVRIQRDKDEVAVTTQLLKDLTNELYGELVVFGFVSSLVPLVNLSCMTLTVFFASEPPLRDFQGAIRPDVGLNFS